MKKLLTFASVIMIVSSALFYSCKKTDPGERHKLNLGNNGAVSLVTYASLSNVVPQLQHIARGYAYNYNTHGNNLIMPLYNYLNTTNFLEETHTQLQTVMLTSSPSIDLENDINSGIVSLGLGSVAYDRSVFYGFSFNNCDYTTNLRMIDSPDLSKPIVFTYEDFTATNQTWGYFWNSTQLDSILLTTLNFDDYLVFVVVIDTDCNKITRRSHGCVGDSLCEPLDGETDENCIDCSKATALPGHTFHALKLSLVRLNEDIGAFEEAWIAGKYELAWDATVAQGNNAVLLSLNGGDPSIARLFSRWKRKQVPMKRKPSKPVKGTATWKCMDGNCDGLFFSKFDPLIHDVYFRFYEYDNGILPLLINGVDKYDINNSIFPLATAGAPADRQINQWITINRGGTYDEGVGSNVIQGVIQIPANSNWTAETIGGIQHMVIYINTPNNEISCKVAYEL